MKRYYTIDISAMGDAGLSASEWMILENIHFLSTDTGWCEKTRKELADHHDLSVTHFRKKIDKLTSKKWLKKSISNHLKTTKIWLDLGGTQKEAPPYSKRSTQGTQKEAPSTYRDRSREIKVFKKPSLSEIRAYIEERKLSIVAKDFYDYFEAGNWKDSKGNKVKNWKQKLLTWEKYSPDTKSDDGGFDYERYNK